MIRLGVFALIGTLGFLAYKDEKASSAMSLPMWLFIGTVVAILALIGIALLRAAIMPDHCGRCGAPVASNQLLCRECRYSGTPA